MIKKPYLFVFVFLFILVGGVVFAGSSTFLEIENQILASRTYPEIRSRIMSLEKDIADKETNLEKRLSFYEGRYDTYNADEVRKELEDLRASKIKNSTVDHCLQVLKQSGYTKEKEEDLRVELFTTLGIDVKITYMFSEIDPVSDDRIVSVFPYETVQIPGSDSQGVTVQGWKDSNGKAWKAGAEFTASYDDVVLYPIWNADVLLMPGNDIDDFVITLAAETESFILPEVSARGEDQSSFLGWVLDGVFHEPGTEVSNPRKAAQAFGIWVNYDVEFDSFEEVDGNDDGALQGGETGNVILNLVRTKPYCTSGAVSEEALAEAGKAADAEEITIALYAPSSLEGIVRVSGKTEVFPMQQGIAVQVSEGFNVQDSLSLIAMLEDQNGNTYYRDVDVAVSQSSLAIEIGQVSYSPERRELFAEVKNLSKNSTLVSPEFTVEEADGLKIVGSDGGFVRTENVKAGESVFLRFYLEPIDETASADASVVLSYADKFGNSGSFAMTIGKESLAETSVKEEASAEAGAEVTMEAETAEAETAKAETAETVAPKAYAGRIVFTDYSVKETRQDDGSQLLKIDLGVFNTMDKALQGLMVEASVDGENWSGFSIDAIDPGMYASSSGMFASEQELRKSLFGYESKPAEIEISSQQKDRDITVKLRAVTVDGMVYSGQFGWTLSDPVMHLDLEKFEVVRLGNNDEKLENGERFGISLGVKNTGDKDLANVAVKLIAEENLEIDGKLIVIPMLKAGEVTSVEFTSDKPYSSQLSGRVSASVTEDKAETVTLLFQKPGKNVLKKEAAIDVTVYKPDFKISNVFISGKETFEWVYPGDKLSLRPVIEYNGAIGLQKVRCVVTSSSQWVSGRASIVLGNLQVGKTMSGSQSRPELQVSASAPIGIEIPIDFTFTDSTERSWVVTYILKTGRSSFNIQMEDVYVIDDGNLKQPLEAAPGQVVQIGFDARNVGLTESPLVQASMEVIQGYGVAASKRISVPTTFKSNTLYSTASVTGGRLTLQVRPDALIGDRIVFRINIYSLMTLIKSQDFVLVVK